MRTRISAVVAALALLLGGLVGLTESPAAAATTAGQVVTVSAVNSTTTFAMVEAWQRQSDGRFKRIAQFTAARIGSQGMGPTSESLSRTPTGQFSLGQGFGVQPDPGAHIPYFKVDGNDVWTGSTGTVINEHRRCAPGTCPSSYGAYERLSSYPQQYAFAAFIGYNAPPPYGTGAVTGKGSAFFLHVANNYPTGGCVAVASSQMAWLLRFLNSGQHPIISIGVGSAAYSPIPNRYI